MDDFRLQGLFEEALEVAATESRELSGEIERLNAALQRLEVRKRAVDDVCRAVRRWADACGIRFAAGQNGEADGAAMVSLSEEEVSLIAYSSGARPDPSGND